MKGKELLMLLAILGVGLWAITRWAGGPGSRASSILAPIASKFGIAAPAKPAEKMSSEQNPKADGQKRTRHRSKSSSGMDSAFPDEPSTITVLVPSAHYPTPGELKLGSNGAEIRSQFGDPSARVSGVRDGVLLERYYYLNSERTRVTVATFNNGVLVSAQDQPR